jgi:solute carrier family 25 (mitochondrial carnitine/acylcarnitine transporter), member 20/29
LQPTLYWKNAKARGLPFTVNPLTVYRGTTASIFNEMQMMALQFGLTGFFQKVFKAHEGSDAPISQDLQDVLSASCGGVISAFFASPVELVMVQQQMYGGSVLSTVKSIVVQNGVFARSGLMRGLLPTVGRDSIYTVGMLGVVPVLQEHMMKDAGISVTAAGFYASILGGTWAALCTHPFDVVKTNMQGDRLIAPIREGSKVTPTANKSVDLHTASEVFRRLWKEGGFRRIYAGASWRVSHLSPVRCRISYVICL